MYDGRDSADNRPEPNLLGTFCSPGETPSVLTSSGRYLYIVYQNSADTNNFKANWKAVTGKVFLDAAASLVLTYVSNSKTGRIIGSPKLKPSHWLLPACFINIG